jgi:uncharacterized damage-inducible protein DinB
MVDDQGVTTPADPADNSGTTRWSASKEHPGLWVAPEDDNRDTGVESNDERSTLLDYLRAYRMTLEMKCADLDANQLALRSVPPSTMSLLGLIRHMAEVERSWFRRVMAGEDAPKLYCTEANLDGDWDDARGDPAVVTDAWDSWRNEVAFAIQFVEEAATLDVTGTMKNGLSISLRDVLVHMIEEYARHCGHADLLRECVDGRVGQ